MYLLYWNYVNGAMNNECDATMQRQHLVCEWLIISLPAYVPCSQWITLLHVLILPATEWTDLWRVVLHIFATPKRNVESGELCSASASRTIALPFCCNGMNGTRGNGTTMANDNVITDFMIALFLHCVALLRFRFFRFRRRSVREERVFAHVLHSIVNHVPHFLAFSFFPYFSSCRRRRWQWQKTKTSD